MSIITNHHHTLVTSRVAFDMCQELLALFISCSLYLYLNNLMFTLERGGEELEKKQMSDKCPRRIYDQRTSIK